MTNQLQKFQHEEFGSVRVIQIDGEPWFVGKDVADALGYTNTKKALIDHVDADDKQIIQRSQIVTLEIPNRGLTIINESGLYSLILSSKLPSAKKFRRWVTSEILPSIRKHSAYVTDDMLDNLIRDPNLVYDLFRKLQSERGNVNEHERKFMCSSTLLAKQADALLDKVEELAPKARYCDIILQTRNAVPITLVAKDYGRSAIFFNQLLHDLGIQHKVGGAWVLYQKYTGKGYTKSHTYYTGSGTAVMHTCWTQKGRFFLYDLLAYYGILPTMETDTDFH